MLCPMAGQSVSVDNNIVTLEGVQLLCLIDKGLDACRYLQAYGYWETAAWLAKVSCCVLS